MQVGKSCSLVRENHRHGIRLRHPHSMLTQIHPSQYIHLKGWCMAATRSACSLPRSERPLRERAAGYLQAKERRSATGVENEGSVAGDFVGAEGCEVECPGEWERKDEEGGEDDGEVRLDCSYSRGWYVERDLPAS